jgi:hypothetical protein
MPISFGFSLGESCMIEVKNIVKEYNGSRLFDRDGGEVYIRNNKICVYY